MLFESEELCSSLEDAILRKGNQKMTRKYSKKCNKKYNVIKGWHVGKIKKTVWGAGGGGGGRGTGKEAMITL